MDELTKPAALAHVLALTKEEASGQRFLTSNGQMSGNDYVLVRVSRQNIAQITDLQALHKYDSNIKNVPKGDASAREKINKDIPFADGSKLTKTLGLKYRPIDETLVDMAKNLHENFGL